MSPPAAYAHRIEVDPVFGCWLWTGKLDKDGYAAGHLHRRVYELLVGPIGVGLLLDHLCRRRRCVRPVHLEPVTNAVNQLRSNPRRRLTRRTCPAGHDLGVHAMVSPEGGKICRKCSWPERST